MIFLKFSSYVGSQSLTAEHFKMVAAANEEVYYSTLLMKDEVAAQALMQCRRLIPKAAIRGTMGFKLRSLELKFYFSDHY